MFKAATIQSRKAYTLKDGHLMGEKLAHQLGQRPDACWLFCAPDRGIDELLRGICESLGTDTLVGCTSSGEISTDGVSFNSAVLGGIATDRIEFEIVTASHVSQDSESAGRELARAFSRTPRYLQIFSDGLTGIGCAILRGMASVLGEHVPVGGGTSGDNGQFKETLQFAGDKVMKDAICAIGFYGDFQLGTGVGSGWAPIGLAKQVTHARGNVLYELNGEPALNVFERFLGKHAENLPAIGVEYPLGFLERWGDVGKEDCYLMRAIMAVNRDERSIILAGEIPRGATVNLTCGDISLALEAADKAAQMAVSDLSDSTPALVFCYSCIARRMILGRRVNEEIQRVRSAISPTVPVIGFYTYGEYCRVTPWSPNFMHNETITLSVIGI
jgi:hypothetical protein